MDLEQQLEVFPSSLDCLSGDILGPVLFNLQVVNDSQNMGFVVYIKLASK